MSPRTRRAALAAARRIPAVLALGAVALALGVLGLLAVLHVFLVEPLQVLAHLIGAIP
ncbi:hypothetical protein NSA53_19910 [Cellulosimicrobium cellulans]|uniref:hypothetical protein n=1 Tax=Cellulosimicrobium cellulans TaxID=1710 RepID=UPI00214A761A|nr:hypothetical protein [Cellulosimicrobium cellulans]